MFGALTEPPRMTPQTENELQRPLSIGFASWAAM
jgi:hypothetical protein